MEHFQNWLQEKIHERSIASIKLAHKAGISHLVFFRVQKGK
jgi:predicted transcriptional regulator